MLIKKHGGFWTLPKGRIKPDEHPIAAVQREVLEETGIAGAVVFGAGGPAFRVVKPRSRGNNCSRGGPACPDL